MNKCQSTFLAYKLDGADLELYTAVAAPCTQPGSISLSCTYFAASKLSLAVIYGCTPGQVHRVEQLLEGCSEVASHPLLMVGVFAELQFKRMEDLALQVSLDSADNVGDSSENPQYKQPSKIRKLNNKIRKGVLDAKEAEEEMRVTKAQLTEMAERMRDQKVAWGTWGLSEDQLKKLASDADRFERRFKEINSAIDGLMTQCRLMADQQTYAGGLVGTSPHPTHESGG
jgi:hypothetical protein